MLDATSGAVPPDSESDRYSEFPMTVYSLQSENRKLVDMNRDLMSQVRVLQSQFDDALAITDGLKNRFMGHHETLRELHAVTLERDDLRDRLGMCQRYNDDLVFEMQRLKQQQAASPSPSPPPEPVSVQVPTPIPVPVCEPKVVSDPALLASVESLKARIQVVESENRQLKAAKEEVVRNQREKLERLVNAVSLFVGRSFSNDSEAVRFLANERNTYDAVNKKMRKQKQMTSELEAKLRTRDRKINELSNEKSSVVRQLTSEIQSLRRRNQEMSEEMVTGRTMISPAISPVKVVTIPPTPSLNTVQNVISESHYVGSGDETQEMQEEAKHQREMISSLQDERSKLQNLLERQTSLTCSLEKKIKAKDEEGKKLTLELRRAQTRVRKLSKYENNTPKVPISIWMCPEFPEDLAKIIEDMAKNTSLQLPTKIRHALTTVTNWFLSREEVIEKQWREDKDALVDLRRKVDTFAEYLHHLLPLDINFHHVIMDENVRGCFGRELMMMKNQLNDLKEEMKQWNDVQDLLNHLSPVDAKERIRELIENEEQLTQRLEDEQRTHEEKYERMEARLEKLTADNQARETRLRRTNEELQQEMENMRSLVIGGEELELRIAKKAEERCAEITQQMNEIQGQLTAALAEIEEAKHVISRLRNKKEKAEKEKQRYKESIERLKERFKDKKERMDKTVVQLKDRIQKQTSDYRQSMAEMNSKMEAINKEKIELSNKIADCSLTLQSMESKIHNTIAQCEREKRQALSVCDAKVQSIEAEYDHRVQEVQAQTLIWKQSLYDKFTTTLSRHLSGVRRMDDGNVEMILQVLNRKLDSAITTDRLVRKYLRIDPYDSIDDALEARCKHRKTHKEC